MAFFEELGKKVSAGGQSVVKQTKSFTEVTKLKAQVSDRERQLNRLYGDLGRLYYDVCGKAPEEAFANIVDAINAELAEIERLKDRINTVRGVVICPDCGAEIEADMAFCPQCGAKKPEPAGSFCAQCGERLQEGQKFCAKCGAKAD